MANGIQKKSEFKSLLLKAAKTKTKLKQKLFMTNKRTASRYSNRMHEKRYLLPSKTWERNLTRFWKRDSTAELETLFAELNKQVTSGIEKCFDFIDKIQKLLVDIQTLSKHCDELAFQGCKKCSEKVTYADKHSKCGLEVTVFPRCQDWTVSVLPENIWKFLCNS